MSDIETIKQAMRDFVYHQLRCIPDFPAPGVDYKDIMPLLQDPQALKYTSYLLAAPFYEKPVDKVIGIESRGFFWGPSIAQDLNAGFAAVRKADKLPWHTISASYQLEYGYDTVEIHQDAVEPHERVLIHDDLLATGGSVSAATNLVNRLGGQVCGYSFIIELTDLQGRQNLDPSVPIETILSL